MTQGNCGRMAVGTRPDSAARGRTRPPPRPPPPPRRCPPPPSAPASLRSPHFLRSPLPVLSGEPLPGGPGGARGGGSVWWGVRRGARGAGLAAEDAGGQRWRARGTSASASPAPGAPRDRRPPWLGALFFSLQLPV